MFENVSYKEFSPFWGVLVIASLSTLIYLLLESYVLTGNLTILIMALIFFTMVISGFVLSNGYLLFKGGSWSQNSFFFVIGYILYTILNYIPKTFNTVTSYFSVSSSALYSSVAGSLPLTLQFLFNGIVIPISEEIFWVFGITWITLELIRATAFGLANVKNLKWLSTILGNRWTQIVIACLISGYTFAIFHVAKQNIMFIVSAILFRTIATIFMFGGIEKLKPISSGAFGFSIGMHIGNNIIVFGYDKAISIMNDNFIGFGGIIYLFAFAIIFGCIYYIKSKGWKGIQKSIPLSQN